MKKSRQPIRNHSELDYYTFQCRHFTGIHQEVCKAGVRYDSVRDINKDYAMARWPCLSTRSGEEAATNCGKSDRWTYDESKTMVEDDNRRVAELLTDLAEGRCPVCHEAVEKRQVGDCAYGSCGHRMYQGKV